MNYKPDDEDDEEDELFYYMEQDSRIIKTSNFEYLVYGHDLNNIYKFSIVNPSETIIIKKNYK